MSRAAAGALAVVLAAAGCDEEDETEPAPSAPPSRGVAIVRAPAGDEPVPHVVKRQLERTKDRQLVVYVGASWCEPCERFKKAARAGMLDEAFPRLTLLEFDLDRDGTRLAAAGCGSPMIPLFAKPRADGTCDPNARIMGSVKGPGAVQNLTPRLRKMLRGEPDAH